MKIPYALAITVTLVFSPLHASASEGTFCKGVEAPLMKSADVDGNGKVDSKDIALIRKSINKNGNYSPLFDRDGNGKVNGIDLHNATRTMGQKVSDKDIAIAKRTDPCTPNKKPLAKK